MPFLDSLVSRQTLSFSKTCLMELGYGLSEKTQLCNGGDDSKIKPSVAAQAAVGKVASWGRRSTMDSVLASHPVAPGSILAFQLKIYFLRKFILSVLVRFIDSALLREWTGQSLIVVQTHLVLVCGKLVLQKSSELPYSDDFLPLGSNMVGWNSQHDGQLLHF